MSECFAIDTQRGMCLGESFSLLSQYDAMFMWSVPFALAMVLTLWRRWKPL